MALDLRDTFEPLNLSQVDTGSLEFNDWEKSLSKADFSLNLQPSYDPTVAFAANLPTFTDSSRSSDPTGALDVFGSTLMGFKTKGNEALKTGYNLKTAAAVGELFSKILTYSMARSNANRAYKNKQMSVENQMLAIDNQVQYYKNQIADKFGQTMARNAMTMAAKGLRVTAGNLLEQTKDAAYDATKDIETLESNARLKKIALRSEEKQAKVARNLTKQLLASDLVGSAAKLGLTISGGYATGIYGSGAESLNKSIYGS